MRPLLALFILTTFTSCQTSEDLRRKKILDEMSMKLEESNKKIGQSDQASANVNLKIDQMIEHIGQMQGQIDEINHRYQKELKEKELDLQKNKELESKLHELGSKQRQIEEYLQKVLETLKGLKKTEKKSLENKQSELKKDNYQQGIDFYNKGDLESAFTALSKFYTASPKSGFAPNALLHIGKILLKQGKKAEAHLAFKKIVEEFPRSARVKEAQKLLAE